MTGCDPASAFPVNDVPGTGVPAGQMAGTEEPEFEMQLLTGGFVPPPPVEGAPPQPAMAASEKVTKIERRTRRRFTV